mmetsp:Transcript_34229/g.54870  ORF Transcript_34229/g.54870 Transcript_34229/m.54870 type:complete len:557 (+) Transcript_34229:67-1737(+)
MSSLFTSTTQPFVEPVSEFAWLVILGGFICFAMAWGIGANDVANCFGTSVGSRAITIKQAVVIASIFEFAGAMALGASVTSTIRKKITDYDYFEGEADVLMLGMFCSLCAASLWLYLATKYQLPVSTTQSIIGAIIGFVIVSKGPQAVVWEQVIYIAIFWVASPVLAAIGSLILFLPSRQYLFRREDSYEKTLLTWPFWVFLVVFIMTLFLLMKGLKRLDLEYTLGTATWISIICGVAAAILAWLVFIKSGIVQKHCEKVVAKRREQKEKKTDAEMADMENGGTAGDKDKETESERTDAVKSDADDAKDDELVAASPKSEASSSRFALLARKAAASASYGVTVDVTREEDMNDLERAIHQNSEVFDELTEEAFAWLQVCTASLDIFAHGSNDVANAVAPFAAMVALYGEASIVSNAPVPWWILFIGAAGMTIGLATYGYKVIATLGVKMVKMSSTRGYCIELASALTVILASHYGFPTSTTHAQVGATVGVGLCEKLRPDSKLKWSTVINWKLLGGVFIGWVATLLIAGITSALLFSILAYSPYAGDASYIDRSYP